MAPAALLDGAGATDLLGQEIRELGSLRALDG